MYGTRHTRDFGESVPDVWKQAIGGLKRHEIERGLRRLTAQGSGSPPTLPQFMKACRQIGDDGIGAENQQSGPALPLIFDKYVAHANKCLLAYLNVIIKDKVTEDELQKLVAEKNRIAEQFKEISTADEVTGKEIKEALFKSFDRLMVA